MDAADYFQMQELEQERMETTLAMLRRIWETGLHSEAIFLAGELGLSRQFTQDLQQRKAA